MKLNPQLKQVTSLTLDQYHDGAEDFWESTRGHDVSQNIAALLRYIEGDPAFTLLDVGCGPVRTHLTNTRRWRAELERRL
jgi:hypothetical protein